MNRKGQDTFWMVPVLFVIGVLVVMSVASIRVISDREVGVISTLGDYKDEEVGTGLRLVFPLLTRIEKVDTRIVEVEEHITVPSADQLVIELDVSTIYKIKPDMASETIQEVSGDVETTLLVPYIRGASRDIISSYTAKELYGEDTRAQVSDKIQHRLEEKLGERLEIEDVLLRDIKLPVTVTEAIEAKIEAEQKAQAKEFELKQAEADAEIDVARAKGIAESNRIISKSITPEYLQWKFIEGLERTNADVIYVPTEGNIPILEAGRKTD